MRRKKSLLRIDPPLKLLESVLIVKWGLKTNQKDKESKNKKQKLGNNK